MQNNRKKVIVGMSGGVDYLVASLLLLEKGYQVEGVFMKNWEEDDTKEYCHANIDIEDARQVCKILGIKLHTANFAAEYWDYVFEHFLYELKNGRTPNPDILCNKEIKFKIFLQYAEQLGADYIATGHYASKTKENGLAKAYDLNKDQSYFLYTLNDIQLKYVLFPLSDLKKSEVRNMAAKAGFANKNKKDSTGICFIGKRKFKEFLKKYIAASPGIIITENGKPIGKHNGLMYYTIGQRHGLGIGGIVDTTNDPWFVLKKDLTNNRLIVGQGKKHPKLYSSFLNATQITWVNHLPVQSKFRCLAKIRYRQIDQVCTVNMNYNTNSCDVIFKDLQRAITPGQSIVFYQKNVCLGGGIIME